MSSRTKKNHILLLIAFVFFPLFLAEVARSISEDGIQYTLVSAGALKSMKVVFIILSIITFITPWLIYQGTIPFRPKQSSSLVRISPEYAVLIYGYFFLFSPVVYGLILFFSGTPITEFYYYILASMAGTLLWGGLNFRNPTASANAKD